jgi:antitoxin HicB
MYQRNGQRRGRRPATNSALAWQLGEAMKAQGLTKTAVAQRMKTGRRQLDRLLNPDNQSVTLSTLRRAATAVNPKLFIEIA